MSQVPVIEVQGLMKSFAGKPVVKGVDLSIHKGEIFGFLGPNGSGKTTTIRMLCGLLTPDGGKGQCLGLDVYEHQEAIRSQVGYMTQKFSLYEDLTVYENLRFLVNLYHEHGTKSIIDDLIERFDLGSHLHHMAGHLSGGWKQRLALAGSLVHQPKLLLLDEPTAGVDPQARRLFWDTVNTLSQEGITILVTTHYMDEAVRCHRLAYLVKGKIKARGTADEMIADSKLHTWSIRGGDLSSFAQKMGGHQEVTQVVFFGHILHVSGHDDKALAKIIHDEKSEAMEAKVIETGLEDVFIYLTGEGA